MAKGLLMLVGKKPKGEEDEGESYGCASYLKEAFAALKDDDEAGFVSALESAIESKMEKE